MVDHPERWSSPFTQVEMGRLWTYSDGALTVKGYRLPGGTARAGSWVLVDQATGNLQGVVPPGEFSRRFRPVDLFADVPGLPTYLGTVTASDGTALVDLVLDRNPFMLANGPRRVARPHALIVPRSHRDGWSSATAQELAACHTAMTLVAAWYRSMDGGHVVFGANDSAPNLDYLRDMDFAGGTLADGGTDVAVTKNPRQEVQHAHLHAFYTERDGTENHESSALEGYPVIGAGHRAFSTALGNDAVKVQPDSTRLAADVSAAAQPWDGSYCSYQLGVDGPFWVTPALGPSMDEFNRRLARADGLKAEPDPKLGGAINLVRVKVKGEAPVTQGAGARGPAGSPGCRRARYRGLEEYLVGPLLEGRLRGVSPPGRPCGGPGHWPGHRRSPAAAGAGRGAIVRQESCPAGGPLGPKVAGPVDTTAVIAPGLFRRCLELAGADPDVDAILLPAALAPAG